MVSDLAKQIIRNLAGLNERVTAADRLDVRMSKAPRVICVSCRRHIYYLKEQSDGSRSFAPTETQTIVRQDLQCPVCNKNLAARMAGQPIIKTDRGWV